MSFSDKRIAIFVNQKTPTKSGKKLNKFNNISYFYPHLVTKWEPIKQL